MRLSDRQALWVGAILLTSYGILLALAFTG